MSFTYVGTHTKDNEQKKFQPDKSGNTAVNVLSENLEDLLQEIIDQLSGAINTTAQVFNVSCAVAGQEYSLALPANTKSFLIRARKNSKIEFAYSALATDILTLSPGVVFKDTNFYQGQSIYFSCSKADEVLEVVAYV